MSTGIKHPHGPPDAPSQSEGYEHQDANPKRLFWWGFGLAIVIILVFLAMRGLFDFYGKVQSLGRPASPFENVRVLPPPPRLQTEPRTDLHTYCAKQMKELGTYGWADQPNGVVRIPIDRAIDLTLQQGLPARAAGEVPAGVSNPAPFVADVTDPTGPCGYVTERDSDHEMTQEARR
jgi:hypothetical protein